MPTPPLLPTASRPFPHLARRAPHECQAGIQGVCRRASLTGSAGAAAGRMSCPDAPGSKRQKHAVLIGWSHPRPSLTGAGRPVRGPRCVGGPVTCCGVWNAPIVVFVLQCHHVILVSYWCPVYPFVHPSVARVLIFNPPRCHQPACSVCLSQYID